MAQQLGGGILSAVQTFIFIFHIFTAGSPYPFVELLSQFVTVSPFKSKT